MTIRLSASHPKPIATRPQTPAAGTTLHPGRTAPASSHAGHSLTAGHPRPIRWSREAVPDASWEA
ncbi:hypothetical protein ACIGXM_36310 [Kitasatospora sp. NPDC052896]|uniref:hypothetical protein n=1 Tax=Kitasatospora sp. NPDC052896 TaxID=3364061 RepID=UPI0037CBC16F